MTDRSVDVVLRVSGDARDGIEVFRALKKGSVETRREFEAATARVSALAQQLAAVEKPSAKLQQEFAAAKREAASLKDVLQQQERRLNSTRQELSQAGVNVKNLAAEYRRLKAEAAAAGAAQASAAAAASSSAARARRLDDVGNAISGNSSGALGVLGLRSSAEIEAEISRVQQALQRLSGDSRISGVEFDRAFAAGTARVAELRGQLDPTTASVARMSGGVGDLRTQLGPLPAALAAVGAALSAQRMLAMAEEYAQAAARLRLATQYTGDYLAVQEALRDVARDSRAPISDTVDLYSKLAPSFAAMGRDGAAAARIVGTVTKSIALSGASAGASQASLVQFAQAMGSGVLRGDELNSILEQTPGLADAIAEGLKVTRGQLRKLGEQGALTSDAVIAALEAVSGRVDKDFAQLPVTVGQSLTLLRNATVELVGGLDRALGATSGLASGIALVSEHIDDVIRFGVPLLALALVPLIARLGLTTAAAVKTAIALAAVNPLRAALGVAAAAAAYAGLAVVLDQVAESQGQLSASEQAQELQRNADARLKVETDLQAATARLQKLRAVAAGKANASILLTTKEAIEKGAEIQRKAIADQIKGYEALAAKLASVWDDAIEKSRALRAESAALLEGAAEARGSGAERAQDRRMRGWTDDERDSYARRESRRLADEARRNAVYAENAAISGNLQRAAQLAAEAAKFAERAERYAELIKDDEAAAQLFEQLGRIQQDALTAQSRIKRAEAAAQEELAAAAAEQITLNEARLRDLRAELEKPATLRADISEAERQIKVLQDQLDKLSDKTVTVRVRTVSDAPADTRGMTRQELIDAIPGRAYGGPLPGRAYGDRSDNVIYRGTPGEWVIQRPAVRYWGSTFMRAINEMRMPKFAYGGELGQEQRAALGDQGSRESIVLQWPDGSRSPMSASRDVADDVLRLFRAAALQRGRRK